MSNVTKNRSTERGQAKLPDATVLLRADHDRKGLVAQVDGMEPDAIF